jgi:hypothetical protein
MAARVLPAAFLSASSHNDFPRYAYVRDIAMKHALARRPATDPSELLRLQTESLKLDLKETEEEREAWQSLAHEEQSKRVSAEAENQRLKAEVERLEVKSAALIQHLENRVVPSSGVERIDRPLESYDDLELWAEEVLGEHVYVHQAALKDCKKNGHETMLKRMESALLVIRDYVVPARLTGGLDLLDDARKKLTEIGMEDSACFVDRNEAKRTPGYSVQYERETAILSDHIKYGNGYDNANQIRIYYFWDDRRKRLVIGKMPSHLRNKLTT